MSTDLPCSCNTLPLLVTHQLTLDSTPTVSRAQWGCIKRCGGVLQNTELTASTTDFLTHGAGYVGVNHDLKHIICAYRGTESIQAAIQDMAYVESKANYISPSNLWAQRGGPDYSTIPSDALVFKSLILVARRIRKHVRHHPRKAPPSIG